MRIGKLLSIVLLIGCQSGEPETTEPEASQFKIELNVPEELQANEPFRLQGQLLNTGNETREISHFVDLFSYWIYDLSGNEVSSGLVQHVPLRDFRSGVTTSEPYTFDDLDRFVDLQKTIQDKSLPAGTYNVITIGSFTVLYGGEEYPIEITSEPVEINVQ
ncbi:hypothetical protein [Paenibacillus daejeonensis]|uniref:hypothetical protein n=1 Tax=Paenibacillus daejeonensis TaxID=135193 RepID=UPI000380289D|nr:hypothetical protein [Paenibacillus daejeonensis]